MKKIAWFCACILGLVPFLRSEAIAPLPVSLIQERQTVDCLKAYQFSYQERLGLDQSFWAKECRAGKTPNEILQVASKSENGQLANLKSAKKRKNLVQESLRVLNQTKNFNAYYDGGRPVALALAGPVSASSLKAGRLPLALPASGASIQKNRSQLLADFEKHLEILGSPKERQVIYRTLSDISGSPTARSLMREFVKYQGHRVVSISFTDVGGESHLLAVHRIDTVKGIQGETLSPIASDPSINIHLSKLYLQADPQWSRADLPDTLSHELLGHALEEMKAAKAGALHSYGQTALEETEAFLVGWTVSAELPLPMTGTEARQYARDYQDGNLQAYYDNFHLQWSEYALLLDPQDMSHPVKNLLRRKEMIEQEAKNISLDRRSLRGMKFVVRHFEKVHGMKKFRHLYARLKAEEANDTIILRDDGKVDRDLRAAIIHYQTAAGRAELLQLKRSFSNPFFPEVEARIKSLSDTLTPQIADKPMFDYGAPLPREGGADDLAQTLALDAQQHQADCAAHFKDVIRKFPEFTACNQ